METGAWTTPPYLWPILGVLALTVVIWIARDLSTDRYERAWRAVAERTGLELELVRNPEGWTARVRLSGTYRGRELTMRVHRPKPPEADRTFEHA